MPDVSIVIPHYNRPEIIGPCLKSLRNMDSNSPAHQVVVVDDASTDSSVAWIKEHHPEVNLTECEQNLGFVGAIQKGIDRAEGEVLVFLNNDTRVEREWLKRLVDPLLSGRIDGATGSLLLDWEAKKALFKGGSINYLGFGFEDQGEIPDPASESYPLMFVCGGAMAIPRKLYKETGGFDPSYGSIYEDLDLGWRLNLMGYECHLIPGSRVAHRAHASFGHKSFEAKARYYIGNSLRTVFKNGDETGHLERIELTVTLAQARERVCLLGENLTRGIWGGFGSLFGFNRVATPIVDSLVREEESSRDLAAKRKSIQEARRVSSRDLFERFVPNPTRGWFYDQEQNRLLEEKGYWEYERSMYKRHGLL